MKPRRSLRTLALIGLLASVAPIANSLLPLSSAHAAAGNITGTVYNDKDSNGANDGSDVGVGGITVTAYDSVGAAVGTTTTAANGTYTLVVSGATTTSVRVEFSTPVNFQPSFVGSGNASSVQFVTIGATAVDYAIEQPGAFCANNVSSSLLTSNLLLASTCIRPGPTNGIAASTNTLTTARWLSHGGNKATLLTHALTGSTWGIAQDPGSGLVWTSAVLRRHAGLGPKGLGGLYVTKPTGTTVLASFDIGTLRDQSNNPILLSANDADYTDAARGLNSTTPISIDLAGYNGAGQVGLGDIDFTPDGYLWVTNVYEKTVLRIAVGGTPLLPTLGAVTEYTIPQLSSTTCSTAGTITNNVAHPWALEYNESNGHMMVGIVCGRESNTVDYLSPMTDGSGGDAGAVGGAAILDLDPVGSGIWTRMTPVLIDRPRWIEGCQDIAQLNDNRCKIMSWKGWSNEFAQIFALNNAIDSNYRAVPRYPQPILSDIETLKDGSLVVGFIDRFSMQLGSSNIKPTETSVNLPWTGDLITGNVAGDLQLLCKTGVSTWTQEASTASGASPQKGGCVGVTTTGGVTYESAARPFTGTFDIGSGPFMLVPVDRQPDNTTYLEFFNDTVCSPTPELTGATYESAICYTAQIPNHVEISQGGMAVWPPTGAQELASTSMDPSNKFDTGGVRWFDMANGDAKWGTVLTEISNQTISTDTSFKKSSSMGDLEILCNAAPIQIGNRVWIDTNRNGIQDPDEPPVAGVTVRLYRNSDSALRGTAKTDSQGRYYFNSTLTTEANTGNGDNVGGLMFANTAFTIKFNNPADYAVGGPLVGYSMTVADQLSATSSLDDSIDSDAYVLSWMPEIAVGPHLAGMNDHTFDVGFVTTTAPVSLGNYVWYDENSDGLQTAGESPVAGVTLTLTDLSGNPVIDVSGNTVGPTTTDATGHYLFSNLHPGSYKVVITYPAGMQATTANVGSDASIDSSTTSATSAMIPAGGQDLTLDFGIVPTNGWNAYNATTTTTSTTSTTVAGGGSGSTSTTVAGGGSGSGSSSTSTSTTVGGSSSGTTTSTVSATTTSSIAPATVVSGGVSVGNYVWIDLNKDGIQDVGEPGITGVKLVLRDIAGRVVTDLDGKTVGPTYTDANGYYYFSNLPVGQYEVSITYPLGYTPTKTGSGTTANDSSTDSAISKSLPTPGMKDYTLDFGVIVSAVIQEQVWIDTNGDGLLTNGEKLVPGADVIILNPDGTPAKNLRGDPVTPVQTQADGSFTFKDLVPGQYKVVVVYPAGFGSSLTGGSSMTFTTGAVIPQSAAALAPTFVVAPPKQTVARKVTPVVSIGNLVWFDTNKDGFQAPTEKGVAGAVLSVFKADGSTRAKDVNGRMVSSQRTSSNGRFLFTNLPPGAYVVKIVYPSGYRATVAKSVGRAKNSSTDVSKSLNLAAGESDMTLDFGLVREPLRRLPATL